MFVRHGQSEANANIEIARPDSPLTEQGKQEAKQTAANLADKHITHILASPMPRARQTAEIIAQELGVKEIEFLDELREKGLGEFEGKHRDHEPEWYFLLEDTAGVESRQSALDRAHTALTKIRQKADQETILVVGHSVSGFYLRQAAAGKTRAADLDAPSHMPNAGYIEVTILS